MNRFEEIWDFLVAMVLLLGLVLYLLVFELLTFWRYVLPENHWLRVKLEGKIDL